MRRASTTAGVTGTCGPSPASALSHQRSCSACPSLPVPLSSTEHSLKLNAEAVAKGRQTDLDELGIAKNAREEKLQARKKEHDPKHHEEMERLYRQHVLKDPGANQPVIQIQGLKRKGKDPQPVA